MPRRTLSASPGEIPTESFFSHEPILISYFREEKQWRLQVKSFVVRHIFRCQLPLVSWCHSGTSTCGLNFISRLWFLLLRIFTEPVHLSQWPIKPRESSQDGGRAWISGKVNFTYIIKLRWKISGHIKFPPHVWGRWVSNQSIML